VMRQLKVMKPHFNNKHAAQFKKDTRTCPYCGRTALKMSDFLFVIDDDGNVEEGILSVEYSCLSCGNKFIADFQLLDIYEIQEK